jgi:hypothetical protein
VLCYPSLGPWCISRKHCASHCMWSAHASLGKPGHLHILTTTSAWFPGSRRRKLLPCTLHPTPTDRVSSTSSHRLVTHNPHCTPLPGAGNFLRNAGCGLETQSSASRVRPTGLTLVPFGQTMRPQFLHI